MNRKAIRTLSRRSKSGLVRFVIHEGQRINVTTIPVKDKNSVQIERRLA